MSICGTNKGMSHPHNYLSTATDHALSYAVDAFDIQVSNKNILSIDAPQTASLCHGESWIRASTLAPTNAPYDVIFINVNGHKREMRYIIAQSTKWLNPNGHIILAGANDSGGKTLAKLCDEYGFLYHEIAKHKHRIFHIYNIVCINASVVNDAIADGMPQIRNDGLWSQPGIFSWDETDKGSAVFLSALSSEHFSGSGADFGCGIGVLAHHLLSTHDTITKIDSIDLDIRATSCAMKNLEQFGARSDVFHHDATIYTSQQKYDFIISNPPFHTGRDVSIKLGQSFIVNAARNLKNGGYFYMVANQTLPYEAILQQYFTHITLLSTARGFKIYKAQK